MQMWNKRLLAMAIALSATTGQVYAAETADADVPAGEEVATHALGETVVTATRTKGISMYLLRQRLSRRRKSRTAGRQTRRMCLRRRMASSISPSALLVRHRGR